MNPWGLPIQYRDSDVYCLLQRSTLALKQEKFANRPREAQQCMQIRFC